MMQGQSPVNKSQSMRDRIRKEFRKPFLKDWNWQFVIILFAVLLLETVLVMIMARRPVEEFSQAEIERIQEQFASFILEEAERQERLDGDVFGASEGVVDETATRGDVGGGDDVGETGESEGESVTSSESREERATERRANRAAAAEVRRQSREAVSKSVSSKGLLGLLTGTGSAADGDAVTSVFSGDGMGEGAGSDLDQILANVDGLQTSGDSGLGGGNGSGSALGGTRGGRSDRRTSIDDLVTDAGPNGTESMTRQGELVAEAPSEVVGLGTRSANRSAEAIQNVLFDHVSAIRYCYERELKRDPNLKGKISVRITVGPEGNVKHAEIVSSTLNNERVERCILARVRLWKDFEAIDPADGDVTFRQIYTFGI
jgi:TonB family protein